MKHTGELLFEVLKERHISPYDLAMVIGVSESYIGDVLHGYLRITPTFAVKLEEALQISPGYWFSAELKTETRPVPRYPLCKSYSA